MQNGTTSGAGASMVSIGDGYWKVSVTFKVRAGTTGTGIQIFAASPNGNATTTHNFNGVDGYLVSAVQIEWGSVAKPYKKTATGQVAKSLGLLVEPTSTNIITNSGTLVGGYANTDGASIISPSTEPAPLTSQFFAKIVEGTGSGTPRRTVAFSGVPAGATVWSSIFVKASERKRALFSNYSFVNWLSRSSIVLDTETGQFWLDGINPEGFVENCGGGIWRIYIKGVLNADVTSGQAAVGPRLDDATTSTGYTGDGVSGIYAWGFQIETGVEKPTSYIPTTTAPATRGVELANIKFGVNGAWNYSLNNSGINVKIGNSLDVDSSIGYITSAYGDSENISRNVLISDINANRDKINISGLPLGFELEAGDKFQINYGNGNVSFHEISNDFKANQNGIATSVEIFPDLPVGINVGSQLIIENAACKMIIYPTSFKAGTARDVITSGLTFKAIQQK